MKRVLLLLGVLLLAGMSRATAATLFAVDASNNLLRFNSASPGTINATTPITGMGAGETILGMDFRPATGQLYILTRDAASAGRLYTLNTGTGAATLAAALSADPTDTTDPYTTLSGFTFGVDFNPVPDRLRVVSDTDLNLRINPINGAVITDGALAFAAPNEAINPTVAGAAYTNSYAGATSTVLYDIEQNIDIIATQNPPNNGTLTPTNPSGLGVNTGAQVGFDIEPGTNTGYAALIVDDGLSTLYSIQSPGGVTSLAGTIGTGGAVTALAVALPTTNTFTINDVTVTEGNSGTANAVFTVTLLRANNQAASVQFTTANGSAVQGEDFTSSSGSLFFAPGESSKTVTVPVSGDTANESSEQFPVLLFNPAGADVARNQGLGTIINDDAPPATNVPDATIFAVDTSRTLLRFNSTTPGTINAITTITGMGERDTILGIDFRPANGQLYAVVRDARVTGSPGRIYTINTTSGAATLVSTISVPLAGTTFGMDFNPVPDRLRLVSDADQNLRINVDTGAAIVDGALSFAAGSSNADQNPNVVGAGYTNSFAGASSTTLYDIDSNLDILTTQNPPNSGTLNTVGPLGVDASDLVGFDIGAGSNTGFAALNAGGAASLYIINLSSGAASPVGTIGSGAPIRALAIGNAGRNLLTINDVTVNEGNSGATNATLTVTLSRVNTQPVAVEFVTASGEAVEGQDFGRTTGSFVFQAGETSKTLTIPILGDALDEVDERFPVLIFNPTGAEVARGQALVTITDDDAPAPPARFSLSGRITSSSGLGVRGVGVTLNGPSGPQSTTTDSNGNYTFANLLSGTYIVTPSAAQLRFSPPSRTVPVSNGNVAGADFIAGFGG